MQAFRGVICGLVLVGSTIPINSYAQTQAQQNKLDNWARYSLAVDLCNEFGMISVPNADEVGHRAITREMNLWGLSRQTIDVLLDDSINRQIAINRVELANFTRAWKNEQERRDVRTRLLSFGKVCIEAGKDTLYAEVIKLPTGYDVEASATEAADRLLEGNGYASWQTSEMRTRADLLIFAGACRRFIGSARSDFLSRTYLQADNARERAYYLRSFNFGLNDPTLQHLGIVKCERGISKNMILLHPE